MYLDFPSAALLAGLPYLLTPPAVGKVAVRNDIVSTGVSVAFIQQATVGVIHVSFVTHSGKRRCMSNTCTVNYRRDGLFLQVDQVEAASFDDAWGGCLIGDPGDDTTRLLCLPDRRASAQLLLLLLCNHLVVSSPSTRLRAEQGFGPV